MDTATIRSRVLERSSASRLRHSRLAHVQPSTTAYDVLPPAGRGFVVQGPLSHRVVKWFTDKGRALQAEDMARADKGRRHEKMADLKPRLRDNTPAIVPEGVKHTVRVKAVPRYAGHVGAVAFGLQRGRVSSNIRDALIQQGPSLALQRAAADEIAKLDADIPPGGSHPRSGSGTE